MSVELYWIAIMSYYWWFDREHSYRPMSSKIVQASHMFAPGPQNISMENSIKNIILEIVPQGLPTSLSSFQADPLNSLAGVYIFLKNHSPLPLLENQLFSPEVINGQRSGKYFCWIGDMKWLFRKNNRFFGVKSILKNEKTFEVPFLILPLPHSSKIIPSPPGGVILKNIHPFSLAWNLPAQDYWKNSQETYGEDTGCTVHANTELVLKTLKQHGLQMVRILL